ncbi:IPT/TIG domain-containing protein [Fulvivirga sp. M361]|uniref:IPT/TIG domain-containing protein n=1 Tax=Fulvivirga sp. M361 TaxID=2594266 RepID=UPI00162A0484|nr:IPT/TIG domain-containing protein [Fulvivirga sp. M361]
MKKINILLLLMSLALLHTMTSCENETDEFDLDFPLPQITAFSPQSDTVGKTVTITGANFERISSISIGGANITSENFEVTSSTSITATLPRIFNAGPIAVMNVFDRGAITLDNFVPLYPTATVSGWPSELNAFGKVQIFGKDLDMITLAIVNGDTASISSAGTTALVIDTKNVNFLAGTIGTEIEISLTGLGDVENQSAFLTLQEPAEELPPGSEPRMLLDFEDGIVPWQEWVDGPVTGEQAGINLGAISPHPSGGDNFLSVLIPNVNTTSWSSEVFFGDVEPEGDQATDTINLGDFRDPHLSFLVNTGSGEARFAIELYESHKWGKWYNDEDGAVIVKTGGTWQWVSISLAEDSGFGNWGTVGWDNDDGSKTDIDFSRIRYIKLGTGTDGFTIGNDYEANIDNFQITDGPVSNGDDFLSGSSTPLFVFFDLEDGVNPYQAINEDKVQSIASVVTDPANAPQGNRFLKVDADVITAGWNWYGNYTIRELNVDIKSQLTPYISFYVHNGNRDTRFEMQLLDANGFGWGTNFLTPANDGWQVITINLVTASWSNWGGAPYQAPDLSAITGLDLALNAEKIGDAGATQTVLTDYVILTAGSVRSRIGSHNINYPIVYPQTKAGKKPAF